VDLATSPRGRRLRLEEVTADGRAHCRDGRRHEPGHEPCPCRADDAFYSLTASNRVVHVLGDPLNLVSLPIEPLDQAVASAEKPPPERPKAAMGRRARWSSAWSTRQCLALGARPRMYEAVTEMHALTAVLVFAVANAK